MDKKRKNSKSSKEENVASLGQKVIPELSNEAKATSSPPEPVAISSPSKVMSEEVGSPSPKKAHLDWDFWKKEPTTKYAKADEKKLFVKDLMVGLYGKAESLAFRVTYKSRQRLTSVGAVFNFHAMDNSGEINVSAFGNECKKNFETVQVNGIYKIVDFAVKPVKNTIYTGLDKVEEIVLRPTSEIRASDENIDPIPFKIIKIDLVSEKDVSSKADILGVFVKDWGLQEKTSQQTGKKYKLRDISITDMSKSTIVVTLWGEDAIQFEANLFDVVAIRGARIDEFDGIRSLKCDFGTLVWVNPTLDGVTELRTWFEQNSN